MRWPVATPSLGGVASQRVRSAPGGAAGPAAGAAVGGPPGGLSRTSRAGTICSIFISGSLNAQPLRRALIAVASVCVAGFMPAAEITARMAAFKSGSAQATIMDRIAKGFTEEEIRAIATWYAAQKP